MTTDTLPKACSVQAVVGGVTVTVTGISKGAGMIRPNMATMLGFMATDARVDPALMQQLSRELADASFNRITIDGDTSTNDSFVVIATNKAAHAPIESLDSADGKALDGGDAHRRAERWRTPSCATARARPSSSPSPCQGGRDPATSAARWPTRSRIRRWSRPRSLPATPTWAGSWPRWDMPGIDDLDQSGIELYLDDVHVATRGGRNPDYQEVDGQRVMQQSEITVRVDLGRGSGERHGLDLRPEPRLRVDQRGLPVLAATAVRGWWHPTHTGNGNGRKTRSPARAGRTADRPHRVGAAAALVGPRLGREHCLSLSQAQFRPRHAGAGAPGRHGAPR